MKEFHLAMQNILKGRKSEIIKTLSAENEELRTSLNDLDGSDIGDIASNDLERQTMDALGLENSKALAKIDGALGRFKNGTYGICGKCGKMIDRDRLGAIPEAVLCIGCQIEVEKKR